MRSFEKILLNIIGKYYQRRWQSCELGRILESKQQTFHYLESNSLRLEFKRVGKFLLILNINQRPIENK